MASALIGALRVHLGLDGAQFIDGLSKSQAGLARFGAMAKVGAAAIVTSMVAAGGAVGVALKSAIDEADQLGKMSQSIGVPVEELSKLKYAAELSDVSLEQLGKGVGKLSVAMVDLAGGGTSPAAKALSGLGISATDASGKLRPTTDVMADLAERFAKMPDGAQKTATAMAVFGKAGAALIPMLNAGKVGLADMFVEAEKLGIVIDGPTAKAAERFNDSLTTLQAAQKGITVQLMAAMMPALESVTGAILGAAKNSALMGTIGKALGLTLKVLASGVSYLALAFIGTGMAIKATYDAMAAFTKGDFKGGAAAFGAGIERAKAFTASIQDFNKTLWAAAPAGAAAARGSNAAKESFEETALAAKSAKTQVAQLTEAEKENQRLREEGKRLTEQMRTPVEKYADEIERLKRLLKLTAIDQETFNRAMADAKVAFDAADDPLGKFIDKKREDQGEVDAQAEAEARKASDDLARDTEERLRDATHDGIVDGLYAAADGNLGDYLAARLKQKLFDGIGNWLTNAIHGSGGGNSIGALSTVFSAGKKLLGFKTGGSFKVGGSGGPDSQLMQFAATPGEMVDIRRPGQANDGGGGAMVVHVNPSPYFDVRVQQIASPMMSQAAEAGADMAAMRMSSASRNRIY